MYLSSFEVVSLKGTRIGFPILQLSAPPCLFVLFSYVGSGQFSRVPKRPFLRSVGWFKVLCVSRCLPSSVSLPLCPLYSRGTSFSFPPRGPWPAPVLLPPPIVDLPFCFTPSLTVVPTLLDFLTVFHFPALVLVTPMPLRGAGL